MAVAIEPCERHLNGINTERIYFVRKWKYREMNNTTNTKLL